MGAIEATDDLEALFDQVAAQRESSPVPAAAPAAPAEEMTAHDVFQRIGHLTRNLHDALRELGYDKSIESAVGSLPDARARLSYVASLTGKAADRVLGAVDRAKAHQEALRGDAAGLGAAWDKLHAGALGVEDFKRLAGDTRAFLAALPARTQAADAELTEIMMAQDFHDLTGQVIQRITDVAQGLEDNLVKLLLEATPPERRAETQEGFLTGPAMNSEKRDDVVANQGQVDDLLESLGF